MFYAIYAFAITLVGLYAFIWIASWILAELAVYAWARKNEMVPLRFEFVGLGQSPDLGQQRTQKLGILTVKEQGKTARLWVAYGPCYFGLTFAQDVVLIRRAEG